MGRKERQRTIGMHGDWKVSRNAAVPGKVWYLIIGCHGKCEQEPDGKGPERPNVKGKKRRETLVIWKVCGWT